MLDNVIDFQKFKSSRNRDTHSNPRQQPLALYPKLLELSEQIRKDPSRQKYEEVNYPPCMTLNPETGVLVYQNQETRRTVVHSFQSCSKEKLFTFRVVGRRFALN